MNLNGYEFEKDQVGYLAGLEGGNRKVMLWNYIIFSK